MTRTAASQGPRKHVNRVLAAPMEGQNLDEKMDKELPVEERSARVISPRLNASAVPRLVSPLRLVRPSSLAY